MKTVNGRVIEPLTATQEALGQQMIWEILRNGGQLTIPIQRLELAHALRDHDMVIIRDSKSRLSAGTFLVLINPDILKACERTLSNLLREDAEIAKKSRIINERD